MKRNVIETIMGAVVLLVAIVFVAVAFSTSDVGAVHGYQVVADFDDASGLRPGTEVRMSGIKVGTVSQQTIDPATYFARITMTIDDAIKLPLGTSARVVPDGLLGANFVVLEPGGEDEMIEAGGKIEYTQGAINVVDLLGRFIFGSAGSPSELESP